MQRQTYPGSSAVSSSTYDEERQELVVTFKSGRSYTYRNVPPDVANDMATADSVGRFVNSELKAYA